MLHAMAHQPRPRPQTSALGPSAPAPAPHSPALPDPRAGSSLRPNSQPVSIPREAPHDPSCAVPGRGGGTGLCARPGSSPCSHCPRPRGTAGPHSALTAFTYISLNSNKLPPPEKISNPTQT